MNVPQLPFPMPTLTFFMNLESDRPGNFSFRMKLQHQESGAIIAQGMGVMPVMIPKAPIIFPAKFGLFQFNAQGLYSFSVEFDGEREPIATTFNVQLVPPNALPQAGGQQRF